MPPARFVCDAMLGGVARKMRIVGFDVLYFSEGPDSAVERIAEEEGRVILTSDRALYAHATRKGLASILVTGQTDARCIAEVVEKAPKAAIPMKAGPSRCADCNSVLDVLSRSDATGRVPQSVSARHRQFFACPSCGKLFWKGGHWERLRKVSALVPRQ